MTVSLYKKKEYVLGDYTPKLCYKTEPFLPILSSFFLSPSTYYLLVFFLLSLLFLSFSFLSPILYSLYIYFFCLSFYPFFCLSPLLPSTIFSLFPLYLLHTISPPFLFPPYLLPLYNPVHSLSSGFFLLSSPLHPNTPTPVL